MERFIWGGGNPNNKPHQKMSQATYKNICIPTLIFTLFTVSTKREEIFLLLLLKTIIIS